MQVADLHLHVALAYPTSTQKKVQVDEVHFVSSESSLFCRKKTKTAALLRVKSPPRRCTYPLHYTYAVADKNNPGFEIVGTDGGVQGGGDVVRQDENLFCLLGNPFLPRRKDLFASGRMLTQMSCSRRSCLFLYFSSMQIKRIN